jgi:hypothetical protein
MTRQRLAIHSPETSSRSLIAGRERLAYAVRGCGTAEANAWRECADAPDAAGPILGSNNSSTRLSPDPFEQLHLRPRHSRTSTSDDG